MIDNSIVRGKYNNFIEYVLNEIIKEARMILSYYPSTYKEFVMAQGVYGFVDRHGLMDYGPFDAHPEILHLLKFIDEWDELVGITGYSVRFTENGKIQRSW